MHFQHLNPTHTLRTFRGLAPYRLQEARKWRARSPHWWPFGPCGAYQFRQDADAESTSFYLNSDFMPSLRWQWADDVDGANIDHTGWFSDEYGDGELIRGIVFALPRGRGWLAGWSMGEGMASEIERYTYASAEDAARAADSMAEYVAEMERERQAQERQEA